VAAPKSGRYVPLVVFPRFTSLVGTQVNSSLPVPVSAYEGANIVVWRGVLIGTAPTFQAFFAESNDQQFWTQVDGGAAADPGAGLELTFNLRFTKAWMKMEVLMGGTGPGCTCWAQGYLQLRER
jgi:hypothetical protein